MHSQPGMPQMMQPQPYAMGQQQYVMGQGMMGPQANMMGAANSHPTGFAMASTPTGFVMGGYGQQQAFMQQAQWGQQYP